MYAKLKDSKIAQYTCTLLGKEGAGLCASRAFFICFARGFLPFSSSSWCRGSAAVCHCGFPWTFFLLTFLEFKKYVQFRFQLEFTVLEQ